MSKNKKKSSSESKAAVGSSNKRKRNHEKFNSDSLAVTAKTKKIQNVNLANSARRRIDFSNVDEVSVPQVKETKLLTQANNNSSIGMSLRGRIE